MNATSPSHATAPQLGVIELSDRISGVLTAGLPRSLWVRGEVSGLRGGRNGTRYFQLIERRVQRTATVSGCILPRDGRLFDRDLADGCLTFTEGIEVLVRGRVSLYAPTGGLQLLVDRIDPAYTLGKAAAARDRTMQALAAAGLLRANAAHPLAAAPLRLGLITAAGSDAEADVVTRLSTSGFAWRVLVADARVQGPECPASVVLALRRMARVHARRSLDAVVITRGGGSRSDLAAFDDETIARAIAAAPFPVLTAIGHQQDRAIADEVAHTAYPTPTAAAVALIEQAQQARDGAHGVWERLAGLARARLDGESAALAAAARAVDATARGNLAGAEASVAVLEPEIRRAAASAISQAERRLGHTAHRLAVAAQRRLDHGRFRLDEARRRLPSAARTSFSRWDNQVDHAGVQLGRVAAGALRDADQALAGVQAQLRALDPAAVLARGYSITRDQHGRTLRSAAQVTPGDLLVTTLANGAIAAVALPHPAGTPPTTAGHPQPPRPASPI